MPDALIWLRAEAEHPSGARVSVERRQDRDGVWFAWQVRRSAGGTAGNAASWDAAVREAEQVAGVSADV